MIHKFTNTTEPETLVPDKFDIEGCAKVYNDWHKSFVDRFKGLPVRIDETLKGGEYYIAVSRDLHDKLVTEIPTEAPEIQENTK